MRPHLGRTAPLQSRASLPDDLPQDLVLATLLLARRVDDSGSGIFVALGSVVLGSAATRTVFLCPEEEGTVRGAPPPRGFLWLV